jgi:hypothetical protein
MPKYLIERTVPGIETMTGDELRELAAASNKVLHDLGPDIQWLHSYVTNGRLYCVYNAREPALIMEHARCGSFPLDRFMCVAGMIDPTTAER